jgi:serine/threonine protein kinase
VGTLRYASSEQVLAVDKLDHRSDVYSLGVTLWELLALRPIYGATEQMPTPELMKRIQHGELERLRKHRRAIPADLEAIVMKCLEKVPARRYATARDLAEDLARCLHGEPIHARPLTWIYVTRKYLHRHLKRMALVLVLVLMQLGLAIGMYHGLKGPPTQEKPPAQPDEPLDPEDAFSRLVVPLGGSRFL